MYKVELKLVTRKLQDPEAALLFHIFHCYCVATGVFRPITVDTSQN